MEIRVITSPTGWVLGGPKKGWPGEFKFGSLSFHWMQKFCSFPMHFCLHVTSTRDVEKTC